MSIAIAEPVVIDVPDEYELVDGELVECHAISTYAGVVASRLERLMNRSDLVDALGQVLPELHFRFAIPQDPKFVRRPDLSFVTFQTLPIDEPLPFRGNPLDVVPELVVEVVSPTDDAGSTLRKMREYLQAGVRSVWIIYPDTRELYAFRGSARSPKVYEANDMLDDEPVLPGFQLKIDALFPPVRAGTLPGISEE